MILLQADGAYVVGPDGRETRLDGAVITVDAVGGATLWFAASDVGMRQKPVPGQCYDARRADMASMVATATTATTVTDPLIESGGP